MCIKLNDVGEMAKVGWFCQESEHSCFDEKDLPQPKGRVEVPGAPDQSGPPFVLTERDAGASRLGPIRIYF